MKGSLYTAGGATVVAPHVKRQLPLAHFKGKRAVKCGSRPSQGITEIQVRVFARARVWAAQPVIRCVNSFQRHIRKVSSPIQVKEFQRRAETMSV